MMASQKIEPMKKISLFLEAGSSHEQLNLSPKPVRFTFIFGVASRGLAPIEYELNDKVTGEELVLPLSRSQFHHRFEHLCPAVLEVFPILHKQDFFVLKIRVEQIAEAGQREIIRAMATAAEGCNAGGDCGCGCH